MNQRYRLAFFKETEKAILVGKDPRKKSIQRGEAFWLPLSQVNIINKAKIGLDWYVDVNIPEWLAERNNIDVSLDGEVIDDE